MLVGGFKASGDVDCVAIRSVVEEAAAAEIPDDRLARMYSNARRAERDAFLAPTPRKIPRARASSAKRACDGAGSVIRLVAGGTEEHLDGIADDLRHRSLVSEHDSVMPTRYSLRMSPSTAGSIVSTREVNPAMSVKREATSRRCPPSSSPAGIARKAFGKIG